MKLDRQKRANIIQFHSYEISTIGKFTETQSSVGVTRGRGEAGMGSYCSMDTKLLFGVNFSEIVNCLEIVVMVAQYCECN